MDLELVLGTNTRPLNLVFLARDYNNGDNFIQSLYLHGYDSLVTNEDRRIRLDDQLRLRIGADLNVSYKDFTLEAEYSFSEMEDFSFSNFQNPEELFKSLHAWNRFLYWTLHYDITDDIFSYVGGSEISYEILGLVSDADYLTIGGGYRINSNLTLKAQYIAYHEDKRLAIPVLNQNNIRAFTNIESESAINFFILGFTAHF